MADQVVRMLFTDAGGPGFKTTCAWHFSDTLSVHPAGNGYLALDRAGEGNGSEEEEWHLTSVTSLSIPSDFSDPPDHWLWNNPSHFPLHGQAAILPNGPPMYPGL